MKALKYGFGMLLVGGFALTASCGGSSDDSSSPSGGTGGTGTATGGTFATGGTTTATGGTFATGGTVAAGGTFAAGGTVATGGTGTGTGGATTTNPATCPPATPTPASGDTCTLPAMMMGMQAACVYGATTCTCNRNFMGGGFGQAGAPPVTEGTLNCRPTPIACAAMPATGDACTRNCPLPNRGGNCPCRMGALVCPAAMGAAGAGG
jgi:hypothetical protein